MSISTELMYIVLHLCHILLCWSYQLCIYFRHWYFYNSLEPRDKAFLDHEYNIITRENETLFIRLWRLFCMTIHFFFPHITHLGRFSHLRAERADNPSAAFLRIVQTVSLLPTDSKCLSVSLNNKLKRFWYRGTIGASKPDHFVLGGSWHIKDIPDPREKLGNDPHLCAIAASTAEQMVEVFNWRIGLGVRRDLRMARGNRPFWDKDLEPCEMESAPAWCKDVGPAKVQTFVDREVGEDTARVMLQSRTIDLSPNFMKRNLIADSLFMYFE